MVTPLFIELFGGLLLLGLIRVGFLYFSAGIKIKESNILKLDQRLYIKALNDYFRDPNNQKTKESVYYFGHSFYSHEYPVKERRNILEFIFNDFKDVDFQQKRKNLIKKDLQGKKMAA
jgi:hypothetical protein